MVKIKSGVPNFFLVLAFVFCTSFFFGILLSSGSSSGGGTNGVIILFMIIAWIFSGIMAFWLFKSFKRVKIKNNSISVSSFFSEKKICKFSDLEHVGWHSEYFHYSQSFHIVATLYDKNGGSIQLNDLELENFDALIKCIPHEGSQSKKRVYKKIANDEYITSIIGLVISVLSFVLIFLRGDGLNFFSGFFISNNTFEDFFFKTLFPIVHVFIIFAFLKRFLRYKNILKKKEPHKKPKKTVNISLKEKIESEFEYLDDSKMGYYSGSWQINGQVELAEVYFYAPREEILQSQIDNFNKLLNNYEKLQAELSNALDKRLKLENHKYLEDLLNQPLHFSIISVLFDKKNHENLPANHDIELIAYKSYKSFGLKRGEDVVATLIDGKIKELDDETL
ncbi:hypothetical protein [Zobellia laminariae]|uniref:hypothetical protein n=2 Tax=Zobellia laminariae TaxID=248906 RepID=UPI003EF8A0FD